MFRKNNEIYKLNKKRNQNNETKINNWNKTGGLYKQNI